MEYILGIVIGSFITTLLWLFLSAFGTLKMDITQEKDLYRLELGDLDTLAKKRYLILKIKKAKLSQE